MRKFLFFSKFIIANKKKIVILNDYTIHFFTTGMIFKIIEIRNDISSIKIIIIGTDNRGLNAIVVNGKLSSNNG